MMTNYNGEKVLRQMYTRSVLLNLAGALTIMQVRSAVTVLLSAAQV